MVAADTLRICVFNYPNLSLCLHGVSCKGVSLVMPGDGQCHRLHSKGRGVAAEVCCSVTHVLSETSGFSGV